MKTTEILDKLDIIEEICRKLKEELSILPLNQEIPRGEVLPNLYLKSNQILIVQNLIKKCGGRPSQTQLLFELHKLRTMGKWGPGVNATIDLLKEWRKEAKYIITEKEPANKNTRFYLPGIDIEKEPKTEETRQYLPKKNKVWERPREIILEKKKNFEDAEDKITPFILAPPSTLDYDGKEKPPKPTNPE